MCDRTREGDRLMGESQESPAMVCLSLSLGLRCVFSVVSAPFPGEQLRSAIPHFFSFFFFTPTGTSEFCSKSAV